MGKEKKVEEPTDYMVLVDVNNSDAWSLENEGLSRAQAQQAVADYLDTGSFADDCLRVARECDFTIEQTITIDG